MMLGRFNAHALAASRAMIDDAMDARLALMSLFCRQLRMIQHASIWSVMM